MDIIYCFVCTLGVITRRLCEKILKKKINIDYLTGLTNDMSTVVVKRFNTEGNKYTFIKYRF